MEVWGGHPFEQGCRLVKAPPGGDGARSGARPRRPLGQGQASEPVTESFKADKTGGFEIEIEIVATGTGTYPGELDVT